MCTAGNKQPVLQNEIDTLAKQYGGRSVPAHLTLMGGIVDDRAGAEERAKSLAEKLRVRNSSPWCIPRWNIATHASSIFDI